MAFAIFRSKLTVLSIPTFQHPFAPQIGGEVPTENPNRRNQGESSAPVPGSDDGLFEKKLTKEEKKKLAAEKKAARKAKKAAKEE